MDFPLEQHLADSRHNLADDFSFLADQLLVETSDAAGSFAIEPLIEDEPTEEIPVVKNDSLFGRVVLRLLQWHKGAPEVEAVEPSVISHVKVSDSAGGSPVPEDNPEVTKLLDTPPELMGIKQDRILQERHRQAVKHSRNVVIPNDTGRMVVSYTHAEELRRDRQEKLRSHFGRLGTLLSNITSPTRNLRG